MTALDRIILTIDSSLGTGEFHMMGAVDLSFSQRTGYIVGGRGSTINSIISDTVGDSESSRQGFYLDLGGGAFTQTLSWRGWEGATDENDNPL